MIAYFGDVIVRVQQLALGQQHDALVDFMDSANTDKIDGEEIIQIRCLQKAVGVDVREVGDKEVIPPYPLILAGHIAFPRHYTIDEKFGANVL